MIPSTGEDAGAQGSVLEANWLMSKPLRARSIACVCAAVSGASINFGLSEGLSI
jgi:hypothetical protein